jgi:hypothetical protein
MCYDRTSEGRKPMCASVCPSGALWFGTREEIERLRPRSRPVNSFQFGRQTVTTKVNMMVPRRDPATHIDVTAAMDDRTQPRSRALNVIAPPRVVPVGRFPDDGSASDPFATAMYQEDES